MSDDFDATLALSHRCRTQREIMLWVADKLRKLEKLPPHAWDRATLRDLYHALEDNPKLAAHDAKGIFQRIN
jgi:hypothetical protein